MSSSNVRIAKTYATIAVGWTIVVGVVFLFLGFALNQLWITLLGVLSVFLAMTAFITTSERLRREEPESARGSCLLWGILLLAFGVGAGVTFLLKDQPNSILAMMSFLYVFAGLFMVLAHSKVSEQRSVQAYVAPMEGSSEVTGSREVGTEDTRVLREEGKEHYDEEEGIEVHEKKEERTKAYDEKKE